MPEPLLVFNQDTNAKKWKQFRVFDKSLRDVMNAMNEKERWERPPVQNPLRTTTTTDDVIKQLWEIFKVNYPYEMHTQKLKKVEVYPYKKEGIQIHLQYDNRRKDGKPIKETDEIYYTPHLTHLLTLNKQLHPMEEKRVKSIETYDWFLLKECKDNFHRDWDRDGICVGDA